MMRRPPCWLIWPIGALVFAGLVAAPLLGWPSIIRVGAVVALIGILAALLCRHRWAALMDGTATEPPARAVALGALLTGVLLFWIVLTRFQSGEINAIDFTVYFDRPCFQTVHGHPWAVETAGLPEFSGRSSLAHHAYWVMLPLCTPYALHPSPLWLLGISVAAIVAGAIYILRAVSALEGGAALAAAAAGAFILSDYTAATLNYGFHPEVLYAWSVAWAVDAGLRRRPMQFVAAAVFATLTKEDALFALIAVSVALGLHRFGQMTMRERALYLLFPVVLAMANLAAFLAFVAPAYSYNGLPANAMFWDRYGTTPLQAALGIARHPLATGLLVLRSEFLRQVLLSFAYLPVIGWRWIVGVFPLVVVYSTSDFPQLQSFGLYYAMPILPFLIIGAAVGARTVVRQLTTPTTQRWTPQGLAVGLLLVPIVIPTMFDKGYSLRPWKAEVQSVPHALTRLAEEPVVLVQSGLYTHAGYDPRVRLLTHHTLRNPKLRGAAVLISDGISAFPLEPDEVDRMGCLPIIGSMPGGLRAVRLDTSEDGTCRPRAVGR